MTAYMIALIASSGLLSIALIAVLIVFFVRKTRNGGGKKKVKVKKASYDRGTAAKTQKKADKQNDDKFKD